MLFSIALGVNFKLTVFEFLTIVILMGIHAELVAMNIRKNV